MRYVNSKTKFCVDLGDLSGGDRAFYEQAVKQFRRNVDWLTFDEFFFDPRSPIYARRRSHLEVLRDPWYLALKDMWLQLGVQQGKIARDKDVTRAGRRHQASVNRTGSKSRPASDARDRTAAGVTR